MNVIGEEYIVSCDNLITAIQDNANDKKGAPSNDDIKQLIEDNDKISKKIGNLIKKYDNIKVTDEISKYKTDTVETVNTLRSKAENLKKSKNLFKTLQ